MELLVQLAGIVLYYRVDLSQTFCELTLFRFLAGRLATRLKKKPTNSHNDFHKSPWITLTIDDSYSVFKHAMSPRREDENGMIVMSEETELSRSPTSFSSDRFIKSLSNLSFEQDEDTASLSDDDASNNNDEAKASLAESLDLITQRGEHLLARVDDILNSNDKSLVVEACQSSLQAEFLFMLEEAKLLLNNMGSTGTECPITSWRVSLAQIRVDAYLESIETALNLNSLKNEESKALNVQLLDVASSIATQLNKKDTEMCISPWNLSCLAFDVMVATPIQHVLEGTLPLNLHVKAIQEIQAMAAGDKTAVSSSRACKLQIARCHHQVGSFRAGAGSVGDVLVTVKVSPMDNDDNVSIEKKKSWDTDNMEASRLVVKEARK